MEGLGQMRRKKGGEPQPASLSSPAESLRCPSGRREEVVHASGAGVQQEKERQVEWAQKHQVLSPCQLRYKESEYVNNELS